MPRFYLQKLVRDKLKQDYAKLGQKAEYRTLSKEEYLHALKQKLIEELNELDPTDAESVASESADVLQALEDLWEQHDLFTTDIEAKKREKFAKKGGFSGATFVEVLELTDDDEWVEYYRKEPAKFPEKLTVDTVPTLPTGLYHHYKGHDYEVLGVARETESMQPYVLYRTINQTPELFWARPYTMFIESVEVDGTTVPRFEYKGEVDG
jgi:predicted house-cleaning noncanonical NTP pyrophosphatase (MazG superfamily)